MVVVPPVVPVGRPPPALAAAVAAAGRGKAGDAVAVWSSMVRQGMITCSEMAGFSAATPENSPAHLMWQSPCSHMILETILPIHMLSATILVTHDISDHSVHIEQRCMCS